MMYLRHLRHVFAASKRLRGDDPMHEHGPDELYGPVRGTAAWWQGMGAPPEQPDEGTPIQAKIRKKRKQSSKNAKPIRAELVERIRHEIASGTYDTQEKWAAALDCLLDRLETDD
jgi:Anti-sigma-28 factor, FlgM